MLERLWILYIVNVMFLENDLKWIEMLKTLYNLVFGFCVVYGLILNF